MGKSRQSGTPKTHRALLAALTATLTALAPAPISAQGVRTLLLKSGFIGSMAEDCTKPPSVEHPYIVYYLAGVDEVRTGLFVDGSGIIYATHAVVAVEEIAPQTLRLKQTTVNAGEFIIYELRIEGRRARTFQSALSTGQVLIANGKAVKDGTDTAWLTLCR